MNFDILPLILVGAGSYFLIKLRFFFLLHPIRTSARALRAIGDKRAARSFFLALAGTLGVGNVFGVALGLLIGGAGSLFWLLVSMIFAMVLKYAEVALASDNLYHDTDTHGGFYYVIRNSFSRLGRLLSVIYSFILLALSLVMGAALQTVALKETVLEVKALPTVFLALAVTLATLVSIIGGARKIEKITAVIIPLTTIIYIFVTSSIVVANISALPNVIKSIVLTAFSVESALGGGIGFLTSRALSEGFARGLLSNEAGAGTSAMAHSRSGVLSPASAGLLGILEVYFDTGLICMLTGLSILLSVGDISGFSGGMELVMYTVGNHLGEPGKIAVLFSVFSFAFATVICWYYYGSESWCSLFGRRSRVLFLPIFLIAVFVGFYLNTYALVSITDVLMTLATAMTLLALIKNSDRVKALSESGGVIDSDSGRIRPFRIKGSVFLKGEKRR